MIQCLEVPVEVSQNLDVMSGGLMHHIYGNEAHKLVYTKFMDGFLLLSPIFNSLNNSKANISLPIFPGLIARHEKCFRH